MKKFINLVMMSLSLFLFSCANLPTPDEMKKATENYSLPKAPINDKALVYIVRPSSFGALVRFNIFLDDQMPASEMGYTRGSQYIYFYTTPGPHKIYSLAENWAEININPKAGDILFLKQSPEIGIIMARNGMNSIEELEGKYHVKSLGVGTVIKEHKIVTTELSSN